jgi:hypothetical protein
MSTAYRRPAAGWATVAIAVLALALLLFGTAVAPAGAVGVAPGWAIASLPQPSNFSNAENAVCEQEGTPCDAYQVTVANVGGAPSDGSPIFITDKLPPGLAVNNVVAKDMESKEISECVVELAEVTCEFTGVLRPGDVINVKVNVVVATNATTPLVTNVVEVKGGGAAPTKGIAPEISPNSVNSAAPPFGMQLFSSRAYGSSGELDMQAGDHPTMLITTLDYNTVSFAFVHPGAAEADASVQEPKSIVVDLPIGLVGDPLAAATCPEADLRENGPGCPADSQVGAVILDEHGALSDSDGTGGGTATSLYNMVPQAGNPMEFAFKVANEGEIALYPRFIPTPAGYALSIAVPAQPRSVLTPVGTTLMFFGDPALRDAELHQRTVERETGQPVALEKVAPAAMFTNPTDCSREPTVATVEMNSWVQPQHWVRQTAPMYEADPLQQMIGCEGLQFSPQIEVKPEETQTDTPSGYTVDIKVPQNPNYSPVLATPDLKEAELHLPAGVAISPAAGTGLVGCRATGPEGINITHGWTPTAAQPLDPADPEAMEIGVDGMPRIAPGHCPPASQVGTIEIVTPLLTQPLTGAVYIAEPECGGEGQSACTPQEAKEGQLFGLYAEAAGSGVIIKLEGRILVDEAGNMTVSFKEAPQLPFTDLQMKLKGGQRALLVNPQGCAVAQTTSTVTPWGASEGDIAIPTLVAEPTSAFQPTGCPASEPFAPGFLAQTSTPTAGTSSPLTVLLTRHDGEQGLYGFELKTPPGVLGMLSQVTPCPEPQASLGTCAPENQIGHVVVAVGAGTQPVWESGAVYLTTGYEGAPFGLSVVTPANVGPFHLGDVVTRAAINVDPHTAALTVDAKLPPVSDGVQLRLKTIDMTIDRPGFMVNPTACGPQKITATVTGALPDESRGTPVAASTPFGVGGCRSLPFTPKMTALAHARTSKANGAYLRVSIAASPGQDNLGKIKVVLPKQLPARLTTLQKACLAAVFEANPASCPPGSVVGTGTVVTSLLKNPLSGPVYLISHGGAAFPDLEVVLQGEGVTITLDGSTRITKGTTSDAFKSLPDAPFSSFQLTLPDGPNALLGANADLCSAKLSMPTALTAQNGAAVKQSTKVAVSGCPKRSVNRRAHNGHGAKRATAKH